MDPFQKQYKSLVFSVFHLLGRLPKLPLFTLVTAVLLYRESALFP